MIYNPYFNHYQQPQAPQIQNSFVTVRSEAEAMNYPVAFGNSVIFKNETEPYIYTKTMGFSPTDKPVFERYKRDIEEIKEEPENDYIGDIKGEIASIWKEIESIKKKGNNDEHTRTRKSGQAKPDNGDAAEA